MSKKTDLRLHTLKLADITNTFALATQRRMLVKWTTLHGWPRFLWLKYKKKHRPPRNMSGQAARVNAWKASVRNETLVNHTQLLSAEHER